MNGLVLCRGEKPIEQLEAALDALYDRKLPFFGRYHLLSAVERRVGGQGLVQFARIGHGTDLVRTFQKPLFIYFCVSGRCLTRL